MFPNVDLKQKLKFCQICSALLPVITKDTANKEMCTIVCCRNSECGSDPHFQTFSSVTCLNLFSVIPSLKVQLPYAVTLNQDWSVSVRTKLGVERSMIRFRTTGGDISLLQTAQTDPGTNPISYKMGTGVLYPGIKQPGRDVNCSPPSSAVVKNDRNYASSSSFALTAWTGDVVTRKAALCWMKNMTMCTCLTPHR